MTDKANGAGRPPSSQFDSDVVELLKLICMNNFLKLYNKPWVVFFVRSVIFSTLKCSKRVISVTAGKFSGVKRKKKSKLAP